jgi:hypothetical protein
MVPVDAGAVLKNAENGSISGRRNNDHIAA